MNTTDFTKTYYINRRGTHSRKWDGEHLKFSRTDLLPLWVADMDFMTPPCLQEAIANYVKTMPLGYTMTNPNYLDAVINWYKCRHNCNLSKDWLTSAPNVITGIMWSIGAFTKPNDAIAVLSPVYGAFDTSTSDAQRHIVPIAMRRTTDNRYTVDYDAFESTIIQRDVKLFIHCNPHKTWLNAALTVIRENYEYLCRELLSALPKLRISPMNGTYLAWIDFGAYVMADHMHDVFENQCRIAPSFGEWFGGESYATFVRLNLATSLTNIKVATHSIIEHIQP